MTSKSHSIPLKSKYNKSEFILVPWLWWYSYD